MKKRIHKVSPPVSPVTPPRDIIKHFVKDCLEIIEEKRIRQMEREHEQDIRIALGLLPDLP